METLEVCPLFLRNSTYLGLILGVDMASQNRPLTRSLISLISSMWGPHGRYHGARAPMRMGHAMGRGSQWDLCGAHFGEDKGERGRAVRRRP